MLRTTQITLLGHYLDIDFSLCHYHRLLGVIEIVDANEEYRSRGAI